MLIFFSRFGFRKFIPINIFNNCKLIARSIERNFWFNDYGWFRWCGSSPTFGYLSEKIGVLASFGKTAYMF